jgi:hypothetical protein
LDHFLNGFVPLVWPIAAVCISLIFRRDLGQALGRVGRVKYRDLELTFREDLHEVERLVRVMPTPAVPAVLPELAGDEAEPLCGRLIVSPITVVEPAERGETRPVESNLEPREAVAVAWNRVAGSLADSGRSGERRHWPGPEGRAVGLLRDLRDRAARPDQPPPSAEDARRYVAAAHRLASRIDEIRRSGSPALA